MAAHKSVLLAFGALLTGILLWEEHGSYTPSHGLTWLKTHLKTCWEWFGTEFARFSAFLVWLDLGRYWFAFWRLVGLFCEVIGTPVWAIHAYIKTSRLYEHPWLVPLGSSLILLSTAALLYALLKERVATRIRTWRAKQE